MIIMETTKAVDNPSYDGRKRSGFASQKLFPKGQRFALTGGGEGVLTVRFVGTAEQIEDQPLVVALLAAAGPVKPASFDEISATLPWIVEPKQVLDELYRSDQLDEGKIREAAKAVHDRALEAAAV